MPDAGFSDSGNPVKADDVISKLKDDGDFDRLRLKIIRKLKENEELRSNIVSMVKQSAVLNGPGAESMKPRQLSDAIHQEIGQSLMNQISDGLWNIIRSSDGVHSEIKETVQSVYDKLLNPEGKDNVQSSSHRDSSLVRSKLEVGDVTRVFAAGGTLSDEELNEPPGFSQAERKITNKQTKLIGRPNHHQQKATEAHKGDNLQLEDLAAPDHSDSAAPPGFYASDEDPDVPPGFG